MAVFYNRFRIGDLFWTLNFLRRLGDHHVLFCQEQHHACLQDMLEGTQIELKPIQDHPPDAIDAWIGSDQKPGRSWYSKGQPKDLIAFLVEWFAELAKEIGREPVFRWRQDLLADYPAIGKPSSQPPFILVIDADPQSSQCEQYRPDEMPPLIERLRARHSVVTVKDQGMSLSEIGRIAKSASLIIGVATGPIWPCLSVHTAHLPIMLILDQAFLDYGRRPIIHVPNVTTLIAELERAGWI